MANYICESEITANCLIRDTTLEIFIGATPITNAFPLLTTDTLASLQATITANTIGAGVTITIQSDSVFPLTCGGGNSGFLHILVQVSTATEITDALIVIDSAEGYNTINVTPFVCALPVTTQKKKNRGAVLARCPDEIIVKSDTSYPEVKYCNQIYYFYITDDKDLLHYINLKSNISKRNTGNWWIINI